MKKVKSFLAATCLFLLFHHYCFAQHDFDSTPKPKNLDSILNAVDTKFSKQAAQDSTLKSVYALSKEDSTLKKALINYQLFGLEHRKKTLQWNLTSSRIIFWSVILLVFTGIVFAGLQFYVSLHPAKDAANNPNATLLTQLEANLKGIKVSSPVLGVIILIISLLFFYLYLVYVYPITEIF